MTFKKFKKDFLAFVESSTVNLGRKNTQTRANFLRDIADKFTAFETDDGKKTVVKKEEKNPDDSDRLVCMKPKNKRRALDIGKGVVSMTSSESQRADEELGRSPFSGKKKKKDE